MIVCLFRGGLYRPPDIACQRKILKEGFLTVLALHACAPQCETIDPTFPSSWTTAKQAKNFTERTRQRNSLLGFSTKSDAGGFVMRAQIMSHAFFVCAKSAHFVSAVKSHTVNGTMDNNQRFQSMLSRNHSKNCLPRQR